MTQHQHLFLAAKFLSYPEALAGYRTYDPANHKVTIVHAPSFCEEACPHPNTIFETPADNSDDDTTDKNTHELLPTDDAPAPPNTPHAPLPATPGHPMRTQHAPSHYDPDDFGAHGHHKEVIANAYEDLINGTLLENTVTPAIAGLVPDDTHLTNATNQADPNLPDSPSLCEALAGPECDKWHLAILEELAAIKEAGTWELVDHSPMI